MRIANHLATSIHRLPASGDRDRVSFPRPQAEAATRPEGMARIGPEHLRSIEAQVEAESRELVRADHSSEAAHGYLERMVALLSRAENILDEPPDAGAAASAEGAARQQALDEIIQAIRSVARSAAFGGVPLLDGTAVISAGEEELSLPASDPEHLGEIEIDGRRFTLADVATGGRLNTIDGDAAEARETIAAALGQVQALRERVEAFTWLVIEPRLASLRVTMENLLGAEQQIHDSGLAEAAGVAARDRLLNESADDEAPWSSGAPARVLSLLE
jgi:hypothetical protein